MFSKTRQLLDQLKAKVSNNSNQNSQELDNVFSFGAFEQNDSLLKFDAEEKNPLMLVKFDTPVQLSVLDESKVNPSISSTVGVNSQSGPYLKRDANGVFRVDDNKMVVIQNKNDTVAKHNQSGVLGHMIIQNITESIPPILTLERKTKKIETAGPKWFDMKAPVITPQIKNDLLILKNRAALDPKRFYKRLDSKELPKFFQMGTIIEAKADFFDSRINKKDRKHTLIETLMDEAEKKNYVKRKFLQIQEKKMAAGRQSKKHFGNKKMKN